MRLDVKTNNFWQATRLRRVMNVQNVERARERGIEPVTLQEASTASPHLPRVPGTRFNRKIEISIDFSIELLVLKSTKKLN